MPPTFIGTFAAGLTAMYSFISVNTCESTRAVRFLILEVIQILSMSVGPLIGSTILESTPLFGTAEGSAGLFNYEGVFITTAACDLCAILWVICAVNEKKKQEPEEISSPSSSVEMASKPTESSSLRSGEDTTRSKRTVWAFIQMIFSPIKELIGTIGKKREDSGRKKIILLLWLYVMINISFNGLAKLFFSLIQRLYNWDAVIWSQVSLIGFMIGPLEMMIFIPILTKYYKFNDIQVAIVGAVSGMLQHHMSSILTCIMF